MSIALTLLALLIWVAPLLGAAALVTAIVSTLDWRKRLALAFTGALLLSVWLLLDLVGASLA
jgi:hypothetical protein